MKKILLLIIVCLFVSGCSINYEVEIYNNKVNETIDLIDKSADSKESIKSKIGDLFQKYEVMYLPREFNSYYNKKDSVYSLRSKGSYKFDQYNEDLNYIRHYCRSVKFSYDKKYIEYEMLGYLKLFEEYEDLDEVNFVVKSNHKVKEHNADETGRYTYIWHINKDNYKDKIPSIKLYSKEYVFDYEGNFVKRVLTILGIVAIISLVSFITYTYFSRRSNKANQI